MRSLIAKAVILGGIGYATVRLSDRAAAATDERPLIRDARAGDRGAFDRLSSDHLETLRRFLKRRVPDSEVEDVLQETMVAAWEHIGTFAGPGRFRTWLFAICMNKVRDFWRRRQRYAPEPLDDDAAAAFVQPEFAAIQLREALRELWLGFTESQQELLELYYGADLTLQEISNVLGRNLSTVKYQFYRAHELAAERLTPEMLEALRSEPTP